MGPHVPASRGDVDLGTRTEHGASEEALELPRAGAASHPRHHGAAHPAPGRIHPARQWHPQGRASSFLLCSPPIRSSLEAAELPTGPCGPRNKPARRRGVTARSCSPAAAGRAAVQGGTGAGAVHPPARSLSPRTARQPCASPRAYFSVFAPNIFKCVVMKYNYENVFSPSKL